MAGRSRGRPQRGGDLQWIRRGFDRVVIWLHVWVHVDVNLNRHLDAEHQLRLIDKR
jgi:hypothetical protein